MSDLAALQMDVRDGLITALRSDLIGPMIEDEILPNPPSRWYLAGFLVPSGAPEDQRLSALATEELDAEVDAERQDGADDMPVQRAYLPSSVGLSVFVPAEVDTLEVEVSWGDYVELDEQETRHWRDLDRARRPETRRRAAEADGDEEDTLNYRYWRRLRTVREVVPVPLTGGEAVGVPGHPGVVLRVVVRGVQGAELPTGTRAVSLFLVNIKDPIQGSAADEASMFQVRLSARCAKGFVARPRFDVGAHFDDARNDLQFRHRVEWGVGHGVATRATVVDGRCVEVATTWLPQAQVRGTRARNLDGVLLGMDELSDIDGVEALQAGLEPLFEAYTAWIGDRRGDIGGLSQSRQVTAERLLDEASLALARMRDGLAAMRTDPDLLEAFRIANAAMAAAARRARPDDETPRWRLFQLAFVLLNLRGIADPEHADRERVELLFFPTGGGKTEAYLGVAAVLMVLRRLRGRGEPHRGAGVAVILRYTLRLLTLDQLRRAAQLICALELQRREDETRLGPERFSIGLWVGRKATANKLVDVARPLNKLRMRRRELGGPPPVPLRRCPWCDHPLLPDLIDLVPTKKAPNALVVACGSDACEFGRMQDPGMPENRAGLPLVVVDEHVYRELPTLLVGTVDKFAALPWRGDVGMLFGRVRARDGAGFYGEHERPPASSEPLPGGLLPPGLIIQDELHLISGPLGTMVGLYETAIDALCRDKTGHGPKVIASTATARRATAQIRALFGRDAVHLFPPQGLDDGDTFFSRSDHRPEKSRIYVGVAAPGRNMKYVAARTYTTLLGAAQRAWKDLPPGPENPADPYMTLVAYFNALKDLGGAQRLVQEEVATRTPRLLLRRPLQEAESTLFAERDLSFDVLELTSRQDTDAISRAISRLSLPFSRDREAWNDVLLATSMISVGIDVPRLGLMVVNGQPRTTAEYIQASSRVGRQAPGLVVAAYNLFKPRDRSHYERFGAYHASFYREIESASVTPFSARAVDRGLAGLVVGLVRHLGRGMAPNTKAAGMRRPEMEPLEETIIDLLVQRALSHRDDVPAGVEDSLRERVEALVKDWRLLVDRLTEDAGLLRYSRWEDPKSYTPLLSSAVDEPPAPYQNLLERFRAPTSMRDVEPGVHVWVDLRQDGGAS